MVGLASSAYCPACLEWHTCWMTACLIQISTRHTPPSRLLTNRQSRQINLSCTYSATATSQQSKYFAILQHTFFIDGEIEAKGGIKESVQAHTTGSICAGSETHEIGSKVLLWRRGGQLQSLVIYSSWPPTQSSDSSLPVLGYR